MAITYRNLPDEDLLHQIAIKQDKDAFGALFARYRHLALGVCLKYLSDEETAKDAVQNIFLKIWTDIHSHQVARFKPWFYKVVKNHCLMELRKQSPSLPPEAVLENENVEWNDYLHLKLKEEQLISHLTNCMKKLKEEQYKCIHSFYLEEKSYQETALATGFSNKAVKSHIQNGRRNLKSCMQAVIGSR